MEPENHALEVRQAFEIGANGHEAGVDRRCAIRRRLYSPGEVYRGLARHHAGAIYGRGYQELGSHCFAYIHATTVGGTHPALIEAMGHGALVLYARHGKNRSGGDTGIPFGGRIWRRKSACALAMSEEERNGFRRRAAERVQERYSWDTVTAEYEELFRGSLPVAAKRRAGVDN